MALQRTDALATQGVLSILSFVSILLFGYMSKNSLVRFAKDGKDTIDANAVVLGTFISPIHAIGVMYHVFLAVQSLSLIFFSSWIVPQNCFLVILFTYVSASLAKGTQYLFFVWRLHVVFDGSSLQVPWTTIRNLLIAIAVAVTNAIGSTILSRFESGGQSWRGMYISPSLTVCVDERNGFSVSTAWSAINYVIFDTLIMITVVYSFLWRVLDVSRHSNKRGTNKMASVAYRSLSLYLFTVWTTYVTIFSMALLGNLTELVSLFDGVLNGLGIIAVFKFADFIYDNCCSACTSCSGMCLLYCMCRKPELQELLRTLNTSDRKELSAAPSSSVTTVSGRVSSPVSPTLTTTSATE